MLLVFCAWLPACCNTLLTHCTCAATVGLPAAAAAQILTYTEAVKTVDHDKALGKPNSLWIAFAKFYEKHGDVDNARVIFNKAVQVRSDVEAAGSSGLV